MNKNYGAYLLLFFVVGIPFANNISFGTANNLNRKIAIETPKTELSAVMLIPENKPAQVIVEPKNEVVEVEIEKLANCESGNNPDRVIIDTNGLRSYGLLQFQLKTFMSYGVKYGVLPDTIKESEAKDLIMSPEIQKEIAGEMIKDGLSYHWKNCMRIISKK